MNLPRSLSAPASPLLGCCAPRCCAAARRAAKPHPLIGAILVAVGLRQVQASRTDQRIDLAAPGGWQPLEKGHFYMTALMRLPSARRGPGNPQIRTGRLALTKSDGDQDRPN